MADKKRALTALMSVLAVPSTTVLAMYVAVWGADIIGRGGGSWGWGYLLALPGGLILGFVLSVVSLVMLGHQKRYEPLPIFLASLSVIGVVFLLSLITHGLIESAH